LAVKLNAVFIVFVQKYFSFQFSATNSSYTATLCVLLSFVSTHRCHAGYLHHSTHQIWTIEI